MSNRDEEINIDITADSKDATKEFSKAGKAFDKFSSGVDKASKGAAIAAGGLLAIGAASLQSAVDAERATTTVNRVFGKSAEDLHRFAEDAAANVGISSAAYEDLAASIGTSLTGMGLSTDAAAAKTDELLQVAGDMALALGTDVPAATDALAGALRGEFDALAEFGVKVDEAGIKAGLAAKGINGPEGMTAAAYDAAYQQELLTQVLGNAGEVYGGYRAETDTTAEKQQNLTAKWDDATAQLGELLLPAIGWVADKLIVLADWIDTNKGAIIQWLPWVAGVTGALWLLNLALAANPIVLITLAVLVFIGVLFYFRDEIGQVITAIGDFLDIMENIVPGLGPARYIIGLFQGDLQSLFDVAMSLTNALQGIIDLWDQLTTTTIAGTPSIPQPPGLRAAPAAFTAAPDAAAADLFGAAAGPSAAGVGWPNGAGDWSAVPGVTVINVSGALDPDAVARQIDRILTKRARRIGSVVTV